MEKKIDGPFLMLRLHKKHGTSQWQITVVNKEGESIRNYGDGSPFDDFTVHAFLYNKEDILRYDGEEKKAHIAFARGVGYQTYSLTELHKAKEMVACLSKVESSLKKQAETYGYPTNFADYILRVAIAIKAKGFLREGNSNGSGAWGYDAYNYHDMDAPSAKYYIENEHREYLRVMFSEQEQAA